MTARPAVAERVARLRALTDTEATELLIWLDATAPRAVDKALEYQAATAAPLAAGPESEALAEAPAPRPSWSSWCSLGADDLSDPNHARCRPQHGPCACDCHSAGDPGPIRPADVDAELAAVDGMDDSERRQVLEHLTGHAPHALAVTLDRVTPGWRTVPALSSRSLRFRPAGPPPDDGGPPGARVRLLDTARVLRHAGAGTP